MDTGDMQVPSWEQLRQTTEFTSIPDFVPEAAVSAFSASMGRYILADSHGFWLEPGHGDGHCDPGQLVVTIGQRIDCLAHMYNSKVTQSPIEDMLAGALAWVDKDWGGMPQFCYADSPSDAIQVFGSRPEIQFWIAPQAKIAGYKADFLLWFSYERVVAGVAIECDGHAFHERTKEQASRDKKRDREILKAGFPVVRFSGSDIFKSPADCAEQVADLLNDALDRVSRAAGLYA